MDVLCFLTPVSTFTCQIHIYCRDALRVGLSKKRKQEEENDKEGSKVVKHKAIFDDDEDNDDDGYSASDDDDDEQLCIQIPFYLLNGSDMLLLVFEK